MANQDKDAPEDEPADSSPELTSALRRALGTPPISEKDIKQQPKQKPDDSDLDQDD